MTDIKDIDEYKSFLDIVDWISLKIFNTILPGKLNWRRYAIAVLYTPIVLGLYVFVSFRVGEGHLVQDNIFTGFVAVFAVSFLLIAEHFIGNNMRDTARYIIANFDIDETRIKQNYLAKIFSKWRIIIGLITGILAGALGLFLVWNFPLAGHTSLAIKYSAVMLLVVLAFLFGEAGSGSLVALYAEYKLMGELSNRMEIMNSTHHEGLKKVASWGLQISLLLSIVSSGFFIGLFTNPHLSEIYVIFPFGLGVLDNQDVLLIIYGLIAFVVVLVIILFVTPIYAISSNIADKKKAELEIISKNYNQIHEQIIADMASGVATTELDREFELVGTLDMMERKVRKVSTIPYDIRSIRRVLEAILIPVVTFLGRNLDIMSLLGFS